VNTPSRRAGCALVALTACAEAAPAHVIYTTGFEVGQALPGPLRGQDPWWNTPGNNFVVVNQGAGEDDQCIVFAPGGNGTSMAHRETGQIDQDSWPDMNIFMLSVMVRLDGVRASSEANLELLIVDGVPGGALSIGLDGGRVFAGSALHDQPMVLGPAIPQNHGVEIMVMLDMTTGDVMGCWTG
jgi:hypothetical protein